MAGIRRGHINPRPEIKIVSESPATAVLDGDRGLGFVVGHHAVAEAMRRARQTGVGVAAVRNSSHYGAGFSYALMAVPHDMVGISLTTGGNLVIPPGGVKPAYGVNVISVAAPTGRSGFPYVLDMATSVVAVGKLEIAARRGQPIPQGWALDNEGRPITDPTRFFAGGGLLPLGGTPLFGAYKGFGLALAVDVLSGALSGSGASAELRAPFAASHCFAALRIDAFLPVAEFKELMDRMIETIKATPRAEGVDEIRIPGELEHALEQERRAAGVVPLHPAVLSRLRKMSEELGISYDLK